MIECKYHSSHGVYTGLKEALYTHARFLDLHPKFEGEIIFCNTKSETEIVEAFMRRRGFDARRINSDLNQSQRNRIMRKIHARELQFLVATDIAARGIDIEAIELVVNFSIHEQAESYVHRTGRTGRAGRKGKAISLVSAHDFMAFRNLRAEIDTELEQLDLPSDEELSIARLAHIEESLRETKRDLGARDVALAKLILRQYGDLEEAPQELEGFIALLTRFAVEHFVSLEAKSLEEELKGEESAGSSKRSGHRGDRKHRRNSGRGGDRGGRKRRGHQRGRSRR